MDTGYTLADLAAVNGGNGLGGNWILILLFAMIFGGNGFGFNRGGEAYATSADVQRGFDTNTLEQQVRGITYGLADVGYALNNSIDAAKDNINMNVGGVKDAVVAEGRGIQGQLAQCCCDNQRNIDSVRYDMANFAAMINSNIDNKFAAIEKSGLEQRIAEQAQQIAQLQMAQQLCGVPRVNPYYFNQGCGCGN